MELIVGTEALRNELRSFAGLVDKGNTLMELSNLLLETKDGKLLITGGDGDVTLQTELGVDHFEEVSPGALCCRADKLTDVLGTLDGNVKSVRFKEEANGWTNLLFNRSHFRITGIKPNLYPEAVINPKPETSVARFPAGLLLQFFNSTAHTISSQDTKFVLTGANLVIGDQAVMTSTDGFRISCIKSPVAGGFSAVFPKKAMSMLGKLLAEVSPEVLVELAAEQNHIFATLGNKRLSFRRITGDFPDVSKPLAVTNDHKVLLSLYDLRAAIRRADIFADKNNQSSVTLTIRPGEVEVYAKSFEEGSGTEIIAATYDGPEVKIRLKSSFLIDFFSSVVGEGRDLTLSVDFSEEPRTPTIWTVHREKDVELGYDYECLITKLR